MSGKEIKCENCIYWHSEPGPSHKGLCRINPPQVVALPSGEIRSYFPMIAGHMSCSQFSYGR